MTFWLSCVSTSSSYMICPSIKVYRSCTSENIRAHALANLSTPSPIPPPLIGLFTSSRPDPQTFLPTCGHRSQTPPHLLFPSSLPLHFLPSCLVCYNLVTPRLFCTEKAVWSLLYLPSKLWLTPPPLAEIVPITSSTPPWINSVLLDQVLAPKNPAQTAQQA